MNANQNEFTVDICLRFVSPSPIRQHMHAGLSINHPTLWLENTHSGPTENCIWKASVWQSGIWKPLIVKGDHFESHQNKTVASVLQISNPIPLLPSPHLPCPPTATPGTRGTQKKINTNKGERVVITIFFLTLVFLRVWKREIHMIFPHSTL